MHGNEDENRKEARRILDRVNRESEQVGTTNLSRIGSSLDDGDEDPIERMGKRIGRSLGWIAMIVLLGYLVSTYVL